jgi:hypothetical protein
MIPVDTRTAAQYRFARHTRYVVRGCLYITLGLIAYFALSVMP